MKLMKYIILALVSTILTASAFAGSEAGDDSARHYRSDPEAFDGEKIDVDCTFVSRINGGPKIDGVVFFLVHTVDEDNKVRGGTLLAAVLEDDVDSFMRKYGTVPDRERGGPDTNRLRGTFHVLPQGRAYVDVSDEAHDLIVEHREENGELRFADNRKGPGTGWKKKKKY